MCECGCGELRPFGKFPAPNGQVYVLEIYPGCGDCGVGPGVSVHRFTKKQLSEMGEMSDLPWRADRPECAIPVIDLAAFRKRFEDEGGEETFYAFSNVGDTLRSVVIRTLADFQSPAPAEGT